MFLFFNGSSTKISQAQRDLDPIFTGNDLDWPLRKLHSDPAKWLPGETLQALTAAGAAQGIVLSAPARDDKNLFLLL